MKIITKLNRDEILCKPNSKLNYLFEIINDFYEQFVALLL